MIERARRYDQEPIFDDGKVNMERSFGRNSESQLGIEQDTEKEQVADLYAGIAFQLDDAVLKQGQPAYDPLAAAAADIVARLLAGDMGVLDRIADESVQDTLRSQMAAGDVDLDTMIGAIYDSLKSSKIR